MAEDNNATRALVLGGGGAAGNAWEIGVIAGLREAGLDVTDADLIVGTSAGATTAAQITAASPTQLFAAVLDAPPVARGGGAVVVIADHMERLRRTITEAQEPADLRRRIGAAALARDPDGTGHPHWRETVADRLPSPDWPTTTIRITAVDACTGEPVVFDRHSGVELVDAVAASTSASVPHRIGDRRYIDGGYRRNENADLAAGYDRVVVLSPFGGRSLHPPEWGTQLATQVDELRAGGSTVATVLPDAAAVAAFGENVMDLSTRPPAARAGYAQGRAMAAELAVLWVPS